MLLTKYSFAAVRRQRVIEHALIGRIDRRGERAVLTGREDLVRAAREIDLGGGG